MDAIITDEALMLAYRDGDYSAFEALYRRHKPSIARFYRRQVGRPIDEELLQEAFLKVINSRERYIASAKFKTLLWVIVRSVLIDHYRQANRSLPPSYSEFEPDSVLADEKVQPDILTEQSHRARKLMELISELPSAQREVFLLKEEAGLSLADISLVISANSETVKSRLRYAVTKLRTGLEGL